MIAIIVRQNFDDGSCVETGIPITASNVNRWIYTRTNDHTLKLVIDIGLTRSLELTGGDAIDAKDFLFNCFDKIKVIQK